MKPYKGRIDLKKIIFYFILCFFCVSQPVAKTVKGEKTENLAPACVLKKVAGFVAVDDESAIYTKGNKWVMLSKSGDIPIVGVVLPSAKSARGRRLLAYLRARYTDEIVKVCHPAYGAMPPGMPDGVIYVEPWPESLQEDLVNRGFGTFP